MDDQWNQNPGNSAPNPDPNAGQAPVDDPGMGGGMPTPPQQDPNAGGMPPAQDPNQGGWNPAPTTPPVEPNPAPEPEVPAQEPEAPAAGDQGGMNQGGGM